MITFQGKEIELDEPLYVVCGTYVIRGSRSWFPIRFGDKNQYDEYKTFKCRIASVDFSSKVPGEITRIKLWAVAISENMHICPKENTPIGGGAYVGKTAQEARKAFAAHKNHAGEK